jgi:hypothetical protein
VLGDGRLRVSIGLRSYGQGRAAIPRLRSANGGAVYSRPGLSEWYRPVPGGVEQGFTVLRPARSSRTPLTVALSLSGFQTATLARGGGAVVLGGGGETIIYSGLRAADAAGRTLPSRLELQPGGRLLLRVDAAGAHYPVRIDPYVQQGPKLEAGEQFTPGRFGRAVALSADGNTALIGSPREENQAGAAYVFTRSGSVWTQQAVLSEAEPASGNFFGRSVALSADGTTALVGDPGTEENVGAAWVFALSEGKWTQQGELQPAGGVGPGQFGRSVALSGDGGTALVGAFADSEKAGAAYVYRRAGVTWSQEARLTGEEPVGPRPLFGRSVALSANGEEALISSPGEEGSTGAVRVFAHSAGGWSQQGPKLTVTGESGRGRLGEYVSLSGDGRTALVGAPQDDEGVGAAWILEASGGTWKQGFKLTPEGESGAGLFGDALALSADGRKALVGAREDAEGTGAAWGFTRNGAEWSQIGTKLKGAEASGQSQFGWSAALSSDGETALVGGLADGGFLGAAWVFVNPPPTPSPPVEPPVTTTSTGGAPPVPGQGVAGTTFVSAPVLGQTGDVTPVGGVVKIKLPGSKNFIVLTGTELIPFGSIIDATNGRVLTNVAGPSGPEQGEFFQGQFLLTQGKDGVVLAKLTGGKSGACPKKKRHHARRSDSDGDHDGDNFASASRRHVVRKLWANAHGTFATRGSYAAGAVQGTEWLTEDLCEGTVIRVTRDKVKVTDLVHHRTRVVKAGHSIFVKAP